ncbi:MAG: glycosyltransferase family 2 protein [Betaproteobacteria bacterium]|nr:glycosyltransferase family 2 protein [Betaproteobacteria bacterium]
MTTSIILPVFGAPDSTRRCLNSVLSARNQTPTNLIVVDDGNDDARLLAHFAELAATGSIRLLRHEKNRGFVAAVNTGLRNAPPGDALLLNSDTIVGDTWVDRMSRCAEAVPLCGTVTPFSNNATICSFPEFCRDNPLPPGWSPAALDGVFRRVNSAESCQIPTGVGFCLLITRQCRESVGLFDEQNFGRGYGEENDYCMRATKLGFHHLLCADLFVYHEGGASFCDEKQERVASAQQTLARLHPEYAGLVAAFVNSDPVALWRNRVLNAMREEGRDNSAARWT